MKLEDKLKELKPSQVVGLIHDYVRRAFGDKIENESKIHASSGYYHIEVPGELTVNVRRKHLAQTLRFVSALGRERKRGE